MTMTMKRYRRPKVSSSEIKVQKSRLEGDVDICIYYGDNVPKCDRALVMNLLGFTTVINDGNESRSLLDELEHRGYDLDTFRFSIKKSDVIKD